MIKTININLMNGMMSQVQYISIIVGFMSEFDKLNIQVSIPCEIYTKFGGRANLIYFLEHGEKELTELKEKLEKVTKIAEIVCMVYGDAFNDDPDSDYNNEFARQKLKELKEILNKEK